MEFKKYINQRFFIISILLFFLHLNYTLIFPEKIAVLERVYSSPQIRVDKDYLYILDLKTLKIDIYSRKEIKYISSFAGSGEAPTEFKFIKIFNVLEDHLYVYGVDKIATFSKTGKLLKEFKTLPYSGGYLPVNDSYVYEVQSFPDKKNMIDIRYNLADSDFKKKKELYSTRIESVVRYKSLKRDILLISNNAKCESYKNRIYIGDPTKGFFFSVYNQNGDNLYQINLPYKKIPITSNEIKEYTDRYIGWKGKKTLERYNPIFLDFFPAYLNFVVRDDKIYVFEYLKNPLTATSQEIYILSLDGKQLKKAKVGNSPALSYDIYGGKYYYLRDNESTEKWELFMESIY